jgi:hypothetical protein
MALESNKLVLAGVTFHSEQILYRPRGRSNAVPFDSGLGLTGMIRKTAIRNAVDSGIAKAKRNLANDE